MLKNHRRTRRPNLLSTFAAALAVAVCLPCASCDSSLPLRAISVNPASLLVAVGSTDQMTAVGSLTDGTFTDLTYQAQWTSSNKAVATVGDDGGIPGLVVGVAAGTVTISARVNGFMGSVQLAVR